MIDVVAAGFGSCKDCTPEVISAWLAGIVTGALVWGGHVRKVERRDFDRRLDLINRVRNQQRERLSDWSGDR